MENNLFPKKERKKIFFCGELGLSLLTCEKSKVYYFTLFSHQERKEEEKRLGMQFGRFFGGGGSWVGLFTEYVTPDLLYV